MYMSISISHPETGEDWAIDVDFNFHKGYPASFDEPGCPDEYCINEVIDCESKEFVDFSDFEDVIIDTLEDLRKNQE